MPRYELDLVGRIPKHFQLGLYRPSQNRHYPTAADTTHITAYFNDVVSAWKNLIYNSISGQTGYS